MTSFQDLDRVIHEKARLGILTALAAKPVGLTFPALKRACDLTDGNLSRHIQTLAEAGLIAVSKAFEGNKPVTTCVLTPEGRQRFDDYLKVLEEVVRQAISARTQGGLTPKLA
jgi:DNA-binding MarR family transcriptional regulator